MDKKGGMLSFDAEVVDRRQVNGRMIVKCAPAVYEIRTNKNGNMYKYCLSNKHKTEEIRALLKEME